jgi:hypothetical protein
MTIKINTYKRIIAMTIKRMNVKKRIPKIAINTDSLIDIPTCEFITGARGETIINGGVDTSTAVIGPANIGKTLFTDNLIFSAANTIMMSYPTYISLYDTEASVKDSRKRKLASNFEYLPDDILDPETGIMDITDKTQYMGDEWLIHFKEFIKEREKSEKITWEGIIDKYTKKPLATPVPTFTFIDSYSEFEPKTSAEAIAKAKLEDGSLNTINMKNGLFKNRVLGELPALLTNSNNRFFTTAHLGTTIDMSNNMYGPKPTKKLQFLKEGEGIKGVSPKFLFLISTVYSLESMRILKNQSTKLPEYPLPNGASNQETDLSVITVNILRSKSGASGVKIPFVSSQELGIDNYLSFFDFIKKNNRFGFEGNDRNYNIVFLPEVKLSRATVRKKLMENYRLRKAIQFAAQLLQLKIYKQEIVMAGYWMEPEELYAKLKAKGYDWNELLDVRTVNTPKQYSEDLKPYLSIMDLLYMANDKYHPYWMKPLKED